MEPTETGTYYFKKERIYWTCNNADDILVFYLTQYFKEHPGHRMSWWTSQFRSVMVKVSLGLLLWLLFVGRRIINGMRKRKPLPDRSEL